MRFEYKTVGGPERGRKRRGARTVADRVAAAMQEIIEAETVDGWEYLRTDLIAVEERSGLFARRQTMHCPVLVFRRALPERAPASPQTGGGRAEPRVNAAPASEPLVLGVAVGRRIDGDAGTGTGARALFPRRTGTEPGAEG